MTPSVQELQPVARGSSMDGEAPPPSYEESATHNVTAGAGTKQVWNGYSPTGANDTAGATTTEGEDNWNPKKATPAIDPEDPEDPGFDEECCDEECRECMAPFCCFLLVAGVIGLIIWAIVEASEGGG